MTGVVVSEDSTIVDGIGDVAGYGAATVVAGRADIGTAIARVVAIEATEAASRRFTVAGIFCGATAIDGTGSGGLHIGADIITALYGAVIGT